MKIYFAGSIRGGREDVKIYEELINHLGNFGTVLTEHIADKNLEETGEKEMSDREIHDRDLDWLKQSDILVAEVQFPAWVLAMKSKQQLTGIKMSYVYTANRKGKDYHP